ncbi:MAG: 2-oxo acid dehydrogenase subunit E2 [Deltaproteobacteria bacterium]|nr:2-oxo acid dehydrogenase subunit E2 [Deltaproteobacteria bacterium]
MPIEIRMPQIASDMTEADLLAWLAEPGERVVSGDVLLEIETDKSTLEIEAPANGTLLEIRVPAGSLAVKVGELLGLIEEEQAREPAEPPAETEAPRGRGEQLAPTAAKTTGTEQPTPGPTRANALAAEQASPAGVAAPATALARRIADRAGLDLASVAGSGARGRVTREDVERRIIATPAGTGSDSRPRVDRPAPERVPLSRMRRSIAERLTAAKQQIPHFYVSADCRADRLIEARRHINEDGQEPRISLNDLIVRACALALREVPDANASWDGDAILLHGTVDVAVAVATQGGLITPVVRDADRKGLAALAAELRDLAERARAGRLQPSEYQGGGFSVSNLGMYGVDSVNPIVNPPQSCILGVGAARLTPVVETGVVTVGSVITLTLSADHRVVDGAVGASLLAAIKRFLEDPLEMML